MPRTRRAEGGERGFGLGLGRVGAGVTSLGESESSWRANLDLRIRRCSGSAAGCTLRCPCDWACQPPIELYSIVAISSTAHPPRIFTGIVEPGSCPGFFTGTALATSTGILVRERSGFEVPRSRAWFGSWPDSRLSLRASPHSPASLEQRLATHGSTKRTVPLVPLVNPQRKLAWTPHRSAWRRSHALLPDLQQPPAPRGALLHGTPGHLPHAALTPSRPAAE